MRHADPEELRALADDLKRIRQDHSNVIEAEPHGCIKQPLDDMLRYAKKRYQDVTEGRKK